uniref:Sushi domain-containing protein n=1 Tax=Hippocampus comes TaxID=109280 RepID=A0A3Q2XUC9_HIPCM
RRGKRTRTMPASCVTPACSWLARLRWSVWPTARGACPYLLVKVTANFALDEHNLITGRAVQFTCDKGYSLVGEALVMCMGGNWTSTFPTCQREKGRKFYVGQSVRVSCPKGQQFRGGGSITCRPDQTWSPVTSACESTYIVSTYFRFKSISGITVSVEIITLALSYFGFLVPKK